MESVVLVYSSRHKGFGEELAALVKACGWRVSPDEGCAILAIADAQGWESEGIRTAWEDAQRRVEARRCLLLWVSSWAPLPAGLPPDRGVIAWRGGVLAAAGKQSICQFLERCAAPEERCAEDTAAPEEVQSAPADEATAAPVRQQVPRPEGVGAADRGWKPVPPAQGERPLGGTVFSRASKSAESPAPVGKPPQVGAVRLPEPPSPVPAHLPPGTGAGASREVRTTAFCPDRLAKGSWFTFQLWLHFPDQIDRVRALAREAGHGQRAGGAAGLKIAPGALVGFSLVPEVLHTKRSLFGARQPVHRYVQWNEDAANVDFAVCCPKGFRGDVLQETVEISVEGIPIGSCTVSFAFDRQGEMATQFARLRSAFASYSSQDRDRVIGRLQMLAATTGLEPFFDVESLRMGEDWQQRLEREVPTKDRFLLFWSENARRSEWVEREWRLALRERGLDYILPVPLEPAAPPRELSKLQFNDRYARLADYERLKAQQGAGR